MAETGGRSGMPWTVFTAGAEGTGLRCAARMRDPSMAAAAATASRMASRRTSAVPCQLRLAWRPMMKPLSNIHAMSATPAAAVGRVGRDDRGQQSVRGQRGGRVAGAPAGTTTAVTAAEPAYAASSPVDAAQHWRAGDAYRGVVSPAHRLGTTRIRPVHPMTGAAEGPLTNLMRAGPGFLRAAYAAGPELGPRSMPRPPRAGSGSPFRVRSAGGGAGTGRSRACGAGRPCGSAGSGWSARIRVPRSR